MKYAYLDEHGLLKVTENKPTGKKVVEVNFDLPRNCAGGNPVINGKQIIVYGLHECYTDGNRTEGAKLDTEKEYPELAGVYRKLM